MQDSLGLERSDLHAASLATLAAALAMQFVMAAVVRRLGPRYCQVRACVRPCVRTHVCACHKPAADSLDSSLANT